MLFPNKVVTYKDSVLSKLPIIAQQLIPNEKKPIELFKETRQSIPDILDFIDALDCLFAIGKIKITEEGFIHYA